MDWGMRFGLINALLYANYIILYYSKRVEWLFPKKLKQVSFKIFSFFFENFIICFNLN